MGLLNQLKSIFVNNQSESADGNRILYLHIGMGKTGSKWLQKYWGLNKEYLQENGIYYPLAEHENPMDVKSLTAGMGLTFLENMKVQETLIHESVECECNDLLVSSEFVFNFFIFDSKSFFESIEKLEKYGFKRVKVLLFVRDIEELILSSYKQLVKVGYKAEALNFNLQNHEELIQSINYFYSKIVELIDWSQSKSDLIELEIRNYSVHKNGLKQISDEWLNMELRDSTIKEDLIVNRSLTAGELFFIEQLNYYNQSYLDLGMELTMNVSHIYKDKEGLDPQLKSKIWEKTKDLRDKLNSHLPEDDRFVQTTDESVESQKFTFTREQITEMARLIILKIKNN
jgi:hypothetical protein